MATLQKPNKAGVTLPTDEWVGKAKKTPYPEDPPEITRKASFYWLQAIGMPLILLIPILGLCRVFDPMSTEATADGEGIHMVMRYPSRLRDRTTTPLSVLVTNTSAQTLNDVEIKLDRDYFQKMQDLRFEPEPDEVDDQSLIFKVDRLDAGESRRVSAMFMGVDLGTYKGWAHVIAAHQERASIPMQTFVFP